MFREARAVNPRQEVLVNTHLVIRRWQSAMTVQARQRVFQRNVLLSMFRYGLLIAVDNLLTPRHISTSKF